MSPGQEGTVMRVKQQTQDSWSQQKQAHLDSQAHLGSWLNSGLFDSKAGSGVNLPVMSVGNLKPELHS